MNCFSCIQFFRIGLIYQLSLTLYYLVGSQYLQVGFFLHPCMDFGVAQRKTANPNLGRKTGLLAHTAFGLGLWLPTLI